MTTPRVQKHGQAGKRDCQLQMYVNTNDQAAGRRINDKTFWMREGIPARTPKTATGTGALPNPQSAIRHPQFL
jgi:hypothetical protein